MRRIALVILVLSLTGCGSTRTENKQTVERYSETTTTPDGQTTTKTGLRTMEEKTDAKTELDLKPSSAVMSWIGTLVGIAKDGGIQQIVMMLLTAATGYSAARTIGTREQSDERKQDLEELWQIHNRKAEK